MVWGQKVEVSVHQWNPVGSVLMEVTIRLNCSLMAKILIPKGRVFAMMTRIKW